ncbi:MAG: rhamnulokinase family protein [Bacteroidales bacterium]
MSKTHFLAFDLGATSGRSILGILHSGKLEMKELNRFPNQMIEVHGKYYWNIFSIYEHLKAGLFVCLREGIKAESIGIDTWGVDFALVAHDGTLLGMPRAYRDPFTEGVPEAFFQKVLARKQVYDITGIQVMNFNTLYQLYALKCSDDAALKATYKLLFMPDALSYLLTGKMVTEYTVASTSQLLNPHTKKMDNRLLEKVGINSCYFADIVMPGHIIGNLNNSLAEETGVDKIPVVAVAGHDTASAIAAIPVIDGQFAYLSSGTWSLMGIEVCDPIINEKSYELNFTNEGGIEGTTRFLKNITGMWLLECCRKEWEKQGRIYSYSTIVNMIDSKTFQYFIDPDDPSFAAPKSMINAIKEYCRNHGFDGPQTDAEFVRCIFESLAMKYRYVMDRLKEFAPHPIKRLHIIGGGAQNDLLNQFTANATGMEVIAGPFEATAFGNILIQAKAMGMVNSIGEMRKIVSNSVELKKYQPEKTKKWDIAYNIFLTKCIERKQNVNTDASQKKVTVN